MSSFTVFTNILANSSLISYAGDWNLSTYVPLSAGAKASISYLGGGISWLGAGELGTYTGNGGITTQIDAASSTAYNWTLLGSPVDDPTSGPQPIPLPFGRHTADFIFGGQERNFTFAGFQMSSNLSLPADLNTTGMSFYGSATVPDDELQYFGDTTTESGVWSQNSPNSNVTYVQGPNTGFAFNFSGAGLTVYGSPNATADVVYAVYFNMSSPPPADSKIDPFNNYTQRAGTGGVIFYVGAMPAGDTRILFVNRGDTPLVHHPGNYTRGLSACYVDCTAKQLEQLAGTQFGAGVRLSPGWAVIGGATAMALGSALL